MKFVKWEHLITAVNEIKNLFLRKKGSTLETYTEKLVAIGGTNIINLLEGNVFNKLITANTSFSIANVKGSLSHSFTLYLETGANLFTVEYPSNIKWEGGQIPELVENKMYIMTFSTIDGGTNWYGNWGEY